MATKVWEQGTLYVDAKQVGTMQLASIVPVIILTLRHCTVGIQSRQTATGFCRAQKSGICSTYLCSYIHSHIQIEV